MTTRRMADSPNLKFTRRRIQHILFFPKIGEINNCLSSWRVHNYIGLFQSGLTRNTVGTPAFPISVGGTRKQGACCPAMAESVTEEANKPGFGMRLAISSIARRFPSAHNVSTHWLDQRLHGGQRSQSPSPPVKILDCRAEDEFNISHIEGAVRINYESSPEELLKLAEIDISRKDPMDVVCYCSVGYRSSLVAEKLQDYVKKSKDAASTNVSVYNLEGSLFKWANENRHMINSQGETTKFAHPYNTVFGKLLNSELRKS